MHNKTTSEVTRALNEFMVETQSIGRTKRIQYIRGDADSSFLSAEFQQWTQLITRQLPISQLHTTRK